MVQRRLELHFAIGASAGGSSSSSASAEAAAASPLARARLIQGLLYNCYSFGLRVPQYVLYTGSAKPSIQ